MHTGYKPFCDAALSKGNKNLAGSFALRIQDVYQRKDCLIQCDMWEDAAGNMIFYKTMYAYGSILFVLACIFICVCVYVCAVHVCMYVYIYVCMYASYIYLKM